jgi:hypothetical protein
MLFPSQYILKRSHALLLVLLGFLIRLIYGIQTKNWLNSPDQIAWQIALDSLHTGTPFSYKFLIHYPHEGGSLVISLLSLVVKPFDFIMPALSLSALLIDTVSRYFQIRIVKKLFGTKPAFWFGIWTIFSIPILLSWSTVNFGLHSLSAFFPFIFIFAATNKEIKFNRYNLCGLVAGLAISFSYDNLVLVPAYFFFLFVTGEKMLLTNSLRFIACALLALCPHFLLRIFADNGFHLEEHLLSDIRGLEWSFGSHSIKNLFSIWYNTFFASFFLSSSFLYKMLAAVLFLGSLLLFVKNKIKNPGLLLSFCLIIFFVAMYALSPLYENEKQDGTFIFYRHFTYILPLVFLTMTVVYTNYAPEKNVITYLIIISCMFSSITYFFASSLHLKNSTRAAGWILSKKYGEDPLLLIRLTETCSPSEKQELIRGFGWGTSAALLNKKSSSDSVSVKQLIYLYNRIPGEIKHLYKEGILFSFSPGITPKLDPAFIQVLHPSISNE